MSLKRPVGRSLFRVAYLQLLLLGTLSSIEAKSQCATALRQSYILPCIDSCAPICEKYCLPDMLSDPKCACTTKAYTKEIFGCLKKSCNDNDFQIISILAVSNCQLYSTDVSGDIADLESGNVANGTTTSSTGGAKVTVTATAEAKKKSAGGFPVGAIVGIVLAVLVGIVVGAFAGCFCVRRRRKVRLGRNHGPITTTATAQVTDPSFKQEPVVKWIPHPASDMYPTVLNQPPIQQNQMVPPVEPPQQFLPHHNLAELYQQPSMTPRISPPVAPVSFPLVELPHSSAQYHAELPTNTEPRRPQ